MLVIELQEFLGNIGFLKLFIRLRKYMKVYYQMVEGEVREEEEEKEKGEGELKTSVVHMHNQI